MATQLKSLSPMIFLAVAVLAGMLVRVVRMIAVKRGLMDIPNARSSHRVPTPRMGGVGFVPAVLAGIWVLAPATVRGGHLGHFFILGAVFVAAIGLIDDLVSLRSSVRFLGQILVALFWIAVCNQAQPGLLSVPMLPGAIVVAFLVVWIAGMINAYNFMDGIDGIAGSQGVVAGIVWFFAAEALHCPTAAVVAGCAAAGSLGFLTLNWPPARIFMGDAGSTALGYTFGALPLLTAAEGGDLTKCLAVGILAMWPFLADTSVTLVLRLRRGENIFSAHRTHFYQRWSDAGTPRRTVLLVYIALAAGGGALALLSIEFGLRYVISFSIEIICSVLVFYTVTRRERSCGVKK